MLTSVCDDDLSAAIRSDLRMSLELYLDIKTPECTLSFNVWPTMILLAPIFFNIFFNFLQSGFSAKPRYHKGPLYNNFSSGLSFVMSAQRSNEITERRGEAGTRTVRSRNSSLEPLL